MESRYFMYQLVHIAPHIFREYDIRGIVGEEITEDVAYTLGRSFASYIKKMGHQRALLGYDNRLSSKAFHDAVTSGMLESGVEVVSLGLVTTPMYYYGRVLLGIPQGIMITASHNPKEYNGFKIAFDEIGNAYGDAIYAFRDFTDKLDFLKEEFGIFETYDIRREYIDLITSSIHMGEKKIRAVIDCGNGTGSIIVNDVMKGSNVSYTPIYCESDGTFPNHHPDPSVHENMIDLSKKVLEVHADLGIGIDGDADRVGIVDEKGNILNADMYLLLMYRYLAPKLKEKKALYDVKCSKSLIDELEKFGYEHTMYRTGNSYINMMMQKGGFTFGGEYSGHMYFKDRFPGFDDGIYAGLRMIELLSNSKESISEMLESASHYESTPELKIKVSEDTKFDIVNDILKYAKEKNYEIISTDGVRATTENAWVLVRASNTGPNLTVRFEAKDKEALLQIQMEFMKEIEESKKRHGIL